MNMPDNSQSVGQLYTVSAPSGAGKTSLVKALVNSLPHISVSISHTTRPKRDGEQDGVNYYFVPQDEFDGMRERGEFLECATVFNNSYGTARAEVEHLLHYGNDVILEIDWQGARQIKQLMPNAMAIFILPPSVETLLERLKTRGLDDEAVIQKRMQAAADEISHYEIADFLVVNDVFATALADLQHIVLGQRLALPRQREAQAELIRQLLQQA